MQNNEFADQVVLITGAGRGRGRLLAEAFAARGAIVAANDISPINVDEAAVQIIANGGRARTYIQDVAKKMGVQALVKEVEDDWGRIDILINHASVEPRVPLLDMDEWDWHRVLDVNLTGTFLMLQSVGRVMRARGRGVIVNLITAASPEGEEKRGAYLASMGGVENLTRTAARELGVDGVRVYGVGENISNADLKDVKMPKSLIEAVMYLCSEEASELNGQLVNVEAR